MEYVIKTSTKHLQKIDEEIDEDKPIPNLVKDGPTGLSTDKSLTLMDILQDESELAFFKIFLSKQFAVQDLTFYTEIKNFFSNKKYKDLKARQIRKQFFNQDYFLGPLSPATKQQQLQILGKQKIPSRPSSAIIRKAQKYVRDRLENKWLPMYMETSEFKQRHLATKPDSDRKKSVDLSNSQEGVFLHQLQEDYVTREKFIKYLATQEEPGQFLVNDLNFWLENERFKEMYRNDVMINMLEKKLQAIITCYLLSPVPPKLQLDISQGIADKITKRDQQTNQHIFKEAQACVFANLFSHCTSFQRFCDSHKNDRLPLKNLEEEAKKRRESLIRREDAHNASKRPVILKRFINKTQSEKQNRPVSSRAAKVAIAFRLSELSPQYEILPACEDTCVGGSFVLKPRVSNIKTERAKVCDYKTSKYTKTTGREALKPITLCGKTGAKPISLPSIPITTRHNNGSSKHPFKTLTRTKHW